MSIVESVKAIMWARRHQPHGVVYGVSLAHERFGPQELLDQAVTAEQAGFDLVCCSDHLAPWWDPSSGPPAHCANTWVWLGAVGVGARGQQVSDREYKMMAIVSADPDTHVRKIKAMRALGATAVVVMNVSGADPTGTLGMYGQHVLPALRR